MGSLLSLLPIYAWGALPPGHCKAPTLSSYNNEPATGYENPGCGMWRWRSCYANISLFSDCHVTGINNNAYQVERGKELMRDSGIEHCVELIKGDFTKLPFPDDSFDAV